jgi:hypothetical protein
MSSIDHPSIEVQIAPTVPGGVTMPQDSENAYREAMAAAFAAVGSNQSREIALRAVAAAARYPGMDLADLMRESAAMAAALTGRRS